MAYSYGRRGNRGRGRGGGRGRWPGNGPFSHLPPWERPGWLYGPGSCWTLGYRGVSTTPVDSTTDIETLRNQKEYLETQLNSLQETLAQIEERLKNLEE
ncbi:MAG: hypothetical protein PVG65_01855 [Candidatus Thorarchaeota archaeon]